MGEQSRATFTQQILQEGDRATFSAMVDLLAAGIPATPTDLIQLIGSASKVVRLTRLEIGADATAAGIFDFYLFKRTAANTGGTASAIAGIAHDTADGAPTAVLQNYTVLPTPLGAGAGIRTQGIALPAATTTGYPFTPIVWDFGTRASKQPTLRGVAESLCLNLAGQALPAGFELWANIEWTESPI